MTFRYIKVLWCRFCKILGKQTEQQTMTLYELWLHSMINRYDVSLHQLYCCVIDLQTSTELNSYIVVLECFFGYFSLF